MNKVVEQFQQLRMEGNIVPHTWYKSPLLTLADGKPNLVAITLLADVIYWYRPAEVRDEASGQTLYFRQKFAADKLQKNYRKWGEGFGFTLRQVEDAMVFLKKNGLLTVERRKVITEIGTFPNCAFIEPVFVIIKEVTYPPDEKKRSPVLTGEGTRPKGRRSPGVPQSPSRPNASDGTSKGEHTKTPSETPLENTSGDAAPAVPEVSLTLSEEKKEPDQTETDSAEPEWQRVRRVGAGKIFDVLAAKNPAWAAQERRKKGGAG